MKETRRGGIACFVLLWSLALSVHAQKPKTNSAFSAMHKAIARGDYQGIDGLLIAQGGKLVYENYFHGFTKDSVHDTRSSFKSITSILVGIAIDKGFIKSVNEPVYTFFPESKSINNDPLKRILTIKDLLEMRSGFDCNEWSADGRDCEAEMEKAKDWVEYSLERALKNEPGKVWAYTSCNPMILSGIISNTAHMSVMKFAEKFLFGTLGISKYRWTTDPVGQGMTAGSFYILPADLLKIGLLVANNGKWKGKQLVSTKWLKESTAATIPIPDTCSFMRISKYSEAIPQQTYYGYFWYTETIKTRSWQEDVIFASGNGGQYIMIINRLKLVVVFTQQNYQSWRAKRAFEILAKYIIPACSP